MIFGLYFLSVAALISIPQPGLGSNGCSGADSLTVRNAHALAYHRGEDAVMLFGGADERQVLGDLWAWNGEAWRCIADAGPPPRTFPALAYEEHLDRLILFGGNRVLFGTEQDTATFLNDMWAWTVGDGWERVDSATPPARAEASVAYDPDRERTVLFGGYRIENGETIRLGDTWEWDGASWRLAASGGPPPRNGTAMAYDTARKRMVLFGGSGVPGETWEWDGNQ